MHTLFGALFRAYRSEADRSESLSCSTKGLAGVWGEDEADRSVSLSCSTKGLAGVWGEDEADRSVKPTPFLPVGRYLTLGGFQSVTTRYGTYWN